MKTIALLSIVALLLFDGCCGGPTNASATAVILQASCEDVRLRCAFSPSCASALHNYFTECDRQLQDDSTKCPEACLFALVALTSNYVGKKMMDCSCNGAGTPELCRLMKSRVEVCRPLVLEAVKNQTVVPCDLAEFMCTSDAACSTAMGFFRVYCKRMLLGEACSERCLNSAEILQRQESAAKLNRCRCDGSSTVRCLRQKERMVRLCYGGGGVPDATGLDPRQQPGGGRKNRKKHRPKMFDLDPDRAEVEAMLADPLHEPALRNRYNANANAIPETDGGGGGGGGGGVGGGGSGGGGGGGGSDGDEYESSFGGGSVASAPSFAVLCSVASALLVMRSAMSSLSLRG